jgi:hypothetical protein
MAPSVTLYDHTRPRFLSGANAVGDSYKINLYSVLPANVTATTKAAAESGATQVATANGYTQDTKTLTGVVVNTVSTTNGQFDADDVTWTASGGSIAAAFALVYNDTDTDDPPVLRIDFDGTVTATDGVPFVISWNASGILTQA